MNLTFGICTSQQERTPQFLEVIQSIHALKVPEYEIIIAGSPPGFAVVSQDPDVLTETDCHYLTDEVRMFTTRGWITRKKNLIARHAKYETLVLLHDYFVFDPYWYQGMASLGFDWDICCCPQTLLDGRRHFTDWVADVGGPRPVYTMIDYTDWSYTKHQYISGGMFLVKKNFLLQNPFAEWMPPGTSEDVEWSRRVRDKAKIVCNPDAKVRHNKAHRDDGRRGFPYDQ
jgi:hypothetical protein